MRGCKFDNIWLFVLCAAILAIASSHANAAEPGASNDWQDPLWSDNGKAANADYLGIGSNCEYSLSLYMWAAGMKATTFSGGKIDVAFDELLRSLDMVFMGAFEVRQCQWSFLADVIYMDLSVDGGAHIPAPIAPNSDVMVNLEADLKMKAWVLNLVGGYNICRTQRATLDIIAGARYLDVDIDFDLGANAAMVTDPRTLSPAESYWDAVVGVKGECNLNQRWFVPYYFDIGTGQTELTWQALAGLGYRFGWGDLALTYRHLEWHNHADEPIEDLQLSGPMLAATFRF